MSELALLRVQGSGAGAIQAHQLGSRAFDLAISVCALILFAPVMLAVALCIYVEDDGPIFFVQSRVGRGGHLFPCMKFRSMVVDAEKRMGLILGQDAEARREYALNRKLRQDPRVTLVGRWIRRQSLDELPQLFNVIMGHMSIVGPRPIMVGEQGAYGFRLRRYCDRRPGITGLWQINGRSAASFRSRVAMDMVYLKHRSFLLDVKILLATLPAVLIGTGSY